MIETILSILICVLLLSSIGDAFFKFLGFGVKVFLSIVLVIASIWLAIKMIVFMIPWMFVLACIAFIGGILWLINTMIKK